MTPRLPNSLAAIVTSAVFFGFSAGAATAQRVPRRADVKPEASKAAQSAKHEEMFALQVLLDRAGFSPGEIDGRGGGNTTGALHAFQGARNLPPSPMPDDATWTALGRNEQQITVAYAIAERDVAGPFVETLPTDLMEQSKLPALDYTDALEAIGERFHVSPALLRELNPTAQFAAGEQVMVPNVEPTDIPTAAAKQMTEGTVPRPKGTSGRTPADDITIEVSKSGSNLIVRRGDGSIAFYAPVTTGSEHDPLPLGTWKVTGVSTLPKFNYNPDLFWDANPTHSKATIPAGPNNPVGVTWIDLSREHYGIHGSPQPSRIGHTSSHGCVRLTNWDAMKLTALVVPGTKVVFKE